MRFVYVIVGGGIAGVSCAETLVALDCDARVLLVSESCLVKSTRNLVPVTKLLTKFDVCEIDGQQLAREHSNICVVHDRLVALDAINKFIVLANKKDEKIYYQYLCLCTGARPKQLACDDNRRVITIRDTDSVHGLMATIRDAKRLAIVGNGGIASELVFTCDRIEIDWIVRDAYVSATFADAAASEFLMQGSRLRNGGGVPQRSTASKPVTKWTYGEHDTHIKKYGAALGPNWYRDLTVTGSSPRKKLLIHCNTEVRQIRANSSGTGVELLVTETPAASETNVNKTIEADLVIVAIGVRPQLNFELIRCENDNDNDDLLSMDENGVFVNETMETSLNDVFAAGDICCPKWTWASNWFPMKLWTQAKQMGDFAAKCMVAKRTDTIDEHLQDFCFELFTHSTSLFGYDIVLLGQFNGQKMARESYDCLVRCTPDTDYIKLVISRNDRCVIGAILIGDCSMAETFENLILNRLDVSRYGTDLLNPDIDIDDYFD